MYKIALLPLIEGEEINIESNIIFQEGDILYINNKTEPLILRDRCFNINDNLKGIKKITFFYENA